MNESDLEALSAYLDGALLGRARRRLERRLLREPALQRALASLRANDRLLTLSLELTAGASGAPPPTPPLAAQPAGRSKRRFGWPAVAASAALAATIGIGIGHGYTEWRYEAELARLRASGAAEQRVVESTLTRALERHLSGQTVDWQDGASGRHVAVTPIRTFRSEAGQWCREFRQVVRDTGQRTATRGIACRLGDGRWQPLVWRSAAQS